jgi:hypothetical protein
MLRCLRDIGCTSHIMFRLSKLTSDVRWRKSNGAINYATRAAYRRLAIDTATDKTCLDAYVRSKQWHWNDISREPCRRPLQDDRSVTAVPLSLYRANKTFVTPIGNDWRRYTYLFATARRYNVVVRTGRMDVLRSFRRWPQSPMSADIVF